MANYQLVHTCTGHLRAVSSVKFSPDGKWVASSSADKTIRVWDLATGQCAHVLKDGHMTGISDCSWSSDSKYLASCADDKNVVVWDVSSATPIKTLKGHNNYVFCVHYNPQSNLIASGSFDEAVRVWDVRTGKTLRVLPAHSDPVTAVCFSPQDGDTLLSGSYDGLCRIWQTQTGQCEKTLFEDQNPPVSCARWSPNQKYVLTSNLDSRLRLYDRFGGKVCKKFEGHKNKKYCLFSCFSTVGGLGPFVVSGSEDYNVYVWDLKSRLIQKLQGHQDVVMGVDCHPLEHMIASGAMTKDKTVKVWRHSELK